MSLIDKLRKARETVVEVEGFKFTIRRPTDEEAISLRNITFVDVVKRYVVGWSGVQELHLIPGGDPREVPFDADLWREWCTDHPEFWQPLSSAILDSYQHYRKSQDETKKKP
jgi:hypothetical protein